MSDGNKNLEVLRQNEDVRLLMRAIELDPNYTIGKPGVTKLKRFIYNNTALPGTYSHNNME